MVHDDDDSNGFEDLTNRKMLQILLQEIADVRRELKEDIANLDRTLSQKIDAGDHALSQKIDTLSSEVKSLRLEVHQNQSAFIRNQADLEQRVAVLELAV